MKGILLYVVACNPLMYAMVVTRPNIAHAVGVVSRFMAKLSRAHSDAMKSIKQYLKGSKSQCLCYGKGIMELKGFYDSKMVEGVDTCKSTSDYVFNLVGSVVSCSRI